MSDAPATGGLPAAVQEGVVPQGFETITEGKATVLTAKGKANAFYNEVQIRNRDLSTLVLNEFARQLEAEALDQIELRKQGKPWRRTPRTWSTWGRQVKPVAEAAPASAQDEASAGPAEAGAGQQDRAAPARRSFEYRDEGLVGMRVLEALAATGLRSIRYAKEVVEGVGLEKIVVNDVEEHAVESIKRNAVFNGLAGDERFAPNCGDAIMLMYKHRLNPDSKVDQTRVRSFLSQNSKPAAGAPAAEPASAPFDVIDLDPYGSPAIFVDSALQSVRDGGLLCVTATDLSTLCGKNSENCFAKYHAMPYRAANFPHEMAIRILLGFLEKQANVYGRHIVPILSVHLDFYIRVFVRVYTDKNEVKATAKKLGLVMHSRACDWFQIQRLGEAKANSENNPNHLVRPATLVTPAVCPETGKGLAVAGPIWAEPIHNFAFVAELQRSFEAPRPRGFDASKLGAADFVQGVLRAVSEELPDAPLYYSLPDMFKTVHSAVAPTIKVHSALENAGYAASRPHSQPNGVKTNAPASVVWDIVRAFAKTQQLSNKAKADPTSMRILEKEPSIQVDFSITRNQRALAKPGNATAARWKPNPKPNWGPKARAPGFSAQQTHKRKGVAQPDEATKKAKPGVDGDSEERTGTDDATA